MAEEIDPEDQQALQHVLKEEVDGFNVCPPDGRNAYLEQKCTDIAKAAKTIGHRASAVSVLVEGHFAGDEKKRDRLLKRLTRAGADPKVRLLMGIWTDWPPAAAQAINASDASENKLKNITQVRRMCSDWSNVVLPAINVIISQIGPFRDGPEPLQLESRHWRVIVEWFRKRGESGSFRYELSHGQGSRSWLEIPRSIKRLPAGQKYDDHGLVIVSQRLSLANQAIPAATSASFSAAADQVHHPLQRPGTPLNSQHGLQASRPHDAIGQLSAGQAPRSNLQEGHHLDAPTLRRSEPDDQIDDQHISRPQGAGSHNRLAGPQLQGTGRHARQMSRFATQSGSVPPISRIEDPTSRLNTRSHHQSSDNNSGDSINSDDESEDSDDESESGDEIGPKDTFRREVPPHPTRSAQRPARRSRSQTAVLTVLGKRRINSDNEADLHKTNGLENHRPNKKPRKDSQSPLRTNPAQPKSVTRTALRQTGRTPQPIFVPKLQVRNEHGLRQQISGTDTEDISPVSAIPGEVTKKLLAEDCAANFFLDSTLCTSKYTGLHLNQIPFMPPRGSAQFDERFCDCLATLITNYHDLPAVNEPEAKDLRKCLLHYSEIMFASCSFGLATTKQYSSQEEWSVKAREPIPKGPIPKLCGFGVSLTKMGHEGPSKLDFDCLVDEYDERWALCGVARYANHSCSPNAELQIVYHDEDEPIDVNIAAVRDIMAGEEITVSYGNEFFGKNNARCACSTCQPDVALIAPYSGLTWPLGSDGPCRQIWYSELYRVKQLAAKHPQGHKFKWYTKPLFIEPFDQAVEKFDKARDTTLIVTVRSKFRDLVKAKKYASYFQIVDLDCTYEDERCRRDNFMEELRLLPPSTSFTIQDGTSTFTVSAKDFHAKLSMEIYGTKDVKFESKDITKKRAGMAWNALDIHRSKVNGPANLCIHDCPHLDALNRAIRSYLCALVEHIGKQVDLDVALDSVSGCVNFLVAGQQGTTSSEHLDLWPGTELVSVFGSKAWLVNTRKLDQKQLSIFRKRGKVDCELRALPFTTKCSLIMTGLTDIEPIHQVHGTQPCVAAGAMFIDERFPERTAKTMIERMSYGMIRNEDLPRGMASIIHILAQIHPSWKSAMAKVETHCKRNSILYCSCSGECTSDCRCKSSEDGGRTCSGICDCNCQK